MRLKLISLLFLCSTLFGQGVSNSTARRIVRGATLPGTCNQSDVFFRTGDNIGFLCGPNNSWVQITSGAAVVFPNSAFLATNSSGVPVAANSASAPGSVIIGQSSLSTGAESTAVGARASSAASGVAVGSDCGALASGAVCIGTSGDAFSANSVAIGGATAVTGSSAIGIGTVASTSSLNGIAIGAGSNSGASNATAFGAGISNSVANSVNIGANFVTFAKMSALGVEVNHSLAGGTAPTLGGACSTSASGTLTDESGKVSTTTTGVCTFTITFGTAYTTDAPSCVAFNETTANLTRPSTTTTVLTVVVTTVSGDVVSYSCRGHRV